MVNPDLLRRIVDEASQREIIGTGTHVACARILNNRKQKVIGKERDTNKEISIIELALESAANRMIQLIGKRIPPPIRDKKQSAYYMKALMDLQTDIETEFNLGAQS